MRRTWLAVALVLLLGGSGASAQTSSGWLVYGNDPARSSSTDTSLSPPSVRPAWYTPISGRVSAQALVAQDVPGPGQRTVYVATSKGVLYALAENGYVRWRVDLGQLERVCQQIDGYGVTGTPAIDLGTHAIYVADAFGRIHALDLATGAERPGWPVTVYTDFRRELVWGALTAVDGSLYFGTGSYCDRKMIAQGLPRRHRDGRCLAVGGRAEAPRRRGRRVGVGRARLQRGARLAVRRHRERVRGRRQPRQALPGVRRLRRADRRDRPRPAPARLEPSARHPPGQRPRLRGLAGDLPARLVRRARGGAEQERLSLPVAHAAPGRRADLARCGCPTRRSPRRCSRRPPTRRAPGRCTSRRRAGSFA